MKNKEEIEKLMEEYKDIIEKLIPLLERFNEIREQLGKELDEKIE